MMEICAFIMILVAMGGSVISIVERNWMTLSWQFMTICWVLIAVAVSR